MPWHRTDVSAEPPSPPGPRPVLIDGRAFILAAWDGHWYAIEDRCSHAGCAFSEDGEIDGSRAICNCHGSEFDVRTGYPVHGPATTSIATFPVRVASALLEVEL